MPASKKDLRKLQQKQNVANGVGDEKGRIASNNKASFIFMEDAHNYFSVLPISFNKNRFPMFEVKMKKKVLEGVFFTLDKIYSNFLIYFPVNNMIFSSQANIFTIGQ